MQLFQWDEEKAEANWRKHGVRFDDAVSAFDDPHYVIRQDCFEAEDRWQIIGMADNWLLLLVVHTIRMDNQTEIFRIISARRINAEERRIYGNRILPKG
jgi:uncharacterized DUF497 family protein